ncbi:4-hydroxyphenylpyruvate dioxygenase-like protein [Cololabis saira]|uniref:4-hydroxyphenylpyruvate dioxygenase-like protein n=1 Tax=Cololabis saira TaxID=129043 RepID=UPI002AD4C980|nr:4-hydroxyphenylpyruvate dioxygenase-like protein [Cololabis saira]
MAVNVLRLHHVAFHVLNAEKLICDLVSKYKFNLHASRVTDRCRQVAFRKGSAVFVVHEGSGSAETSDWLLGEALRVNEGKTHRRGNGSPAGLYDASPRHPVDTVSNVCFEVENVERSFKVLSELGCGFLVPPTTVQDDHGLVTYSVLRSIVGNVCHTLIDKSKYGGGFLPGFDTPDPERDCSLLEEDVSCPVTHFDHVTYACHQKSTHQVMGWYEKMFGFRRFFIVRNEDEDEGCVIHDKGIGLRLAAMQYWKCSEVGIALPFKNKKEPDCKFVIAESLPNQGSNQVDTFLEQHNGPGIQHIALYTKNIVSTTHTLAEAGVQFFSPPPAYYTEVGKRQEIEEVGHTPQMLAQHGILLDADVNQDLSSQNGNTENKKYLLQVFTKPIFNEDTFFLELIERKGATGFGEGNIKALWKCVEAYMENERQDSQRAGAPKTVRTAQY